MSRDITRVELSGLFANPCSGGFVQLAGSIVKSLDEEKSRPKPGPAPLKTHHKIHLTEAQMQDLAASYLCGATTVELATQYDIHHTTVSKYLKKRGIAIRLKALTEKDVALAIELYRSGLSSAKVAERIGRAPNTIRAQLLAAGVKMRDVRGRDRG
jgi:DNA-binding CsgD family transcriptional regulator